MLLGKGWMGTINQSINQCFRRRFRLLLPEKLFWLQIKMLFWRQSTWSCQQATFGPTRKQANKRANERSPCHAPLNGSMRSLLLKPPNYYYSHLWPPYWSSNRAVTLTPEYYWTWNTSGAPIINGLLLSSNRQTTWSPYNRAWQDTNSSKLAPKRIDAFIERPNYWCLISQEM